MKGFIRAGLLWLAVGVLLGVSMAFFPGQAFLLRTAHAHANLLGFVSMMIFGVAYHVIPRFAATPLWSRRLAGVHFWVSNLGLTLLVAGWAGRSAAPGPGGLAVRGGAVLAAAGALLFVANIWRTLDRAPDLGTPPEAPRLARLTMR